MTVDHREVEFELPEKFAGHEYQVLIVAEKYQTGFDEPLLHTVYVDKKLAGVHAVQTLSRLNRTMSGKTDTFVLDFVNEAEDIREAFEPYYAVTAVGEQVEPALLDEVKEKLFAFRVFSRDDVDDFARVFFKAREKQSSGDHAKLDAILGRARSEWLLHEEEEREETRSTMVAYRNLYALASQIIPYVDAELEKLYAFVRFLLRILPPRSGGGLVELDDEVALKAYRLEKTRDDESIALSGDDNVLPGRMVSEPVVDAGLNTGEYIRRPDVILDEYYAALGYDAEGRPTPETLSRLGLTG